MEERSTEDSGQNSWKLLTLARLPSKGQMKGAVNCPSISNIYALANKNFITIKRNLPLLFFLFISPALFVILNCISIGNSPRSIPIGVTNLESNCSDPIFTSSCQADMLSCYLEESLNGSGGFDLKKFSSVSKMYAEAKIAAVRATFIIPQNFSVSYLKRILKTVEFDEFIYFYDILDDELIGEYEKIYIAMDMSYKPMLSFIRQALKKTLSNFDEKVKKICENDIGDDLDCALSFDPTASLGDEDFGFLEYLTPGNIVMPIYFMAVARTADAFISERSQGLLERSWIAGNLGEIYQKI